jgi:DNA-directed RNA polymerase specialized sigma24 family protein
MNIKSLNKLELYQIAIHDDCDLTLRYEATRELQRRARFDYPETYQRYDAREEKIIAQLYQGGYMLSDIAERFGRSTQGIKDKLRSMRRQGLPVRTFMRWTPNGKVPGGKVV